MHMFKPVQTVYFISVSSMVERKANKPIKIYVTLWFPMGGYFLDKEDQLENWNA